jgi:hypothetical protein
MARERFGFQARISCGTPMRQGVDRMRNTHHVAEQSWTDGAATVVDEPIAETEAEATSERLEWDADEGQTRPFGRDAGTELQWVGMVGWSQGRAPEQLVTPLPVKSLPGVRRLSPAARAFLTATEPRGRRREQSIVEASVERTERTPRPWVMWLGPKGWVGFAAGMLAGSLVLLVVAVVIARSGREAAGSVAGAGTNAAARGGASLPARLEAVDAVTVRAPTSGLVRRAAGRGVGLRAGEMLVELRHPNGAAAQRLAELNALLDEYEDSPEHAAEITRARTAYERASRGPALSTVGAPFAGVVVAPPPRPGAAVAAGDELAQLAASVQLVVPSSDVEGNGAACHVVLLDRQGMLLEGQLVPSGLDAHTRTIALAGFPGELPMGMIGRARAICP